MLNASEIGRLFSVIKVVHDISVQEVASSGNTTGAVEPLDVAYPHMYSV